MPSEPSICRLAFIIRDLGRGGAQRQLTALASALAQRAGWEVTVVHFYPGPFEAELHAAGVRTQCVGKRGRWDLAGFFWRMASTLRDLRPDVIHGYLNEGNLTALLLKPFCRHPRPRIVWGLRDSRTDAHLWGWLGRLSFWLNCRLSRFADLIIANSKAGRDYYLQQGYPPERVKVVANGIDVSQHGGAADLPKGAAEGGSFVFGLVGRLNAMKGHSTFLAAAAIVAARCRGARFLIVGGAGEADAEAPALLAQAESAGLARKVIWLPAQRDMASLYTTLDCLVSASRFGEGFSNVIGEAMAAGLPVVATDVGDSAWLVDDPARICPPDNPAELAARMIAVWEMPPRQRAEIGARSRLRIQDHFTLEAMIQKTSVLIAGLRKPLRVCFLTTGLGTGGAEMMLWQITTRLDRARFAPSVISLTAGGKYLGLLQAAGVPVVELGMPAGKPTPGALWRLFRAARALRPDVYMGWMYHGCLAAVLARFASLRRRPVIWNIRQSLYDLNLEKRGSAMVIRLLAWLSFVPKRITYNSRVSAGQHEAAGYRSAKTALIPNGFDTTRWQPRATHRADGPDGADLRIGRFGRYAAMKDYPGFLKAAALLVRDFPRVQILLAGTGVDSANPELTRLVADLNLSGHVQLLGERDDLPALTASLDLAVSSSSFGEGFPNVVGEAMACGVPVVATDIGDTAWVAGDTGRLVPPGDPAALAAACREVLTLTPTQRHELGLLGRDRIVERFSMAAVMLEFQALLRGAFDPQSCKMISIKHSLPVDSTIL